MRMSDATTPTPPPTLPAHLARLRRACEAFASAVDEFGNDASAWGEALDDLDAAHLAFDRAELAPDDEPTSDFNARVVSILEDIASARRR